MLVTLLKLGAVNPSFLEQNGIVRALSKTSIIIEVSSDDNSAHPLDEMIDHVDNEHYQQMQKEFNKFEVFKMRAFLPELEFTKSLKNITPEGVVIEILEREL